ncbi:MAG: response regulator transcription factor [Geminicoccaceae bacterium]
MNVLLVEDDERIIEFVRRGLEAEGYQVEVARNGRDALQRARSPTCQLIILDLLLPDLDGRDVCRQLRAAELGTPILMLTALDTLDDKVRGLRMGADDYLAKPFAFEELVARVQALARRRAAYRDDQLVLSTHDLVLDRGTREVRRGDRPIQLTPREFALLECLMRAPGKVLSRPQILEKVWGCSKDPLTNVVDVYIRQLRRKLDRDAPVPLIQTVRGFGYKIRSP